MSLLGGNTPGSARVAAKQLGNHIVPYAVGAFGSVVGIVIVEDAARDQMARHDAQVEIEATKEMGQTPRSYGEMREQYRERSISRVFVEKGLDFANAIFKSPPKHSK